MLAAGVLVLVLCLCCRWHWEMEMEKTRHLLVVGWGSHRVQCIIFHCSGPSNSRASQQNSKDRQSRIKAKVEIEMGVREWCKLPNNTLEYR